MSLCFFPLLTRSIIHQNALQSSLQNYLQRIFIFQRVTLDKNIWKAPIIATKYDPFKRKKISWFHFKYGLIISWSDCLCWLIASTMKGILRFFTLQKAYTVSTYKYLLNPYNVSEPLLSTKANKIVCTTLVNKRMPEYKSIFKITIKSLFYCKQPLNSFSDPQRNKICQINIL